MAENIEPEQHKGSKFLSGLSLMLILLGLVVLAINSIGLFLIIGGIFVIFLNKYKSIPKRKLNY